MKFKINRKKIFLLFFAFQIILFQLFSLYPKFVEQFYSNGIYLFFSHFFRIILGKISISVGDLLYLLFIFLGFKWILKIRKIEFKNVIWSVISFISVFYFVFHFFWGINYFRQPLFEKMNIKREYSDADLLDFTQKLIKQTNIIHFKITKNSKAKVIYPYSQNQIFDMSLVGYKKLAQKYSYFDYNYKSIKKSVFSKPLSYMGFSGYLNPFTNEAQVNYLVPFYHLPMITCHEMAHQMGYASESECNFIGFLATTNHKNLYFQYSGYTTALKYCLNILKIQNKIAYEICLKSINIGILKNYDESIYFFKKYQSPIEIGFYYLYDRFLKLNQQKEGIESYSKFVNLMINYYKN